MIVVLDTNIWISALFFGGKPEQALLKAFEEGEVAVCQQLVDEIEEVAVRKFHQRVEHVKERLESLLVSTVWITVPGTLQVCRDPDDDILLECAHKAGAQLIITGDSDLLELVEFRGIRILTAEQYLAY